MLRDPRNLGHRRSFHDPGSNDSQLRCYTKSDTPIEYPKHMGTAQTRKYSLLSVRKIMFSPLTLEHPFQIARYPGH